MMESGSAKDQQISIVGQEFHENEVPECQGCKKREAQFVCAGCGNQWYCSRECQVSKFSIIRLRMNSIICKVPEIRRKHEGKDDFNSIWNEIPNTFFY